MGKNVKMIVIGLVIFFVITSLGRCLGSCMCPGSGYNSGSGYDRSFRGSRSSGSRGFFK